MSRMQNFALCARVEKQPKAELESYRKTPQADRTNIVALPHTVASQVTSLHLFRVATPTSIKGIG